MNRLVLLANMSSMGHTRFQNSVKVFLGSKQITTPPITPDPYLQVRKESVKSYDPSVNQSNDRSLDDLDTSLAPSMIIDQPAVQFSHVATPRMTSVTPSMKSQDTEASMKLTETNLQLVKTLEAMMKAMDGMEKRNGIL